MVVTRGSCHIKMVVGSVDVVAIYGDVVSSHCCRIKTEVVVVMSGPAGGVVGVGGGN